MLGPDLSEVGKRLNREQLLESLTQPSKTIAPEYRIWTVETKGGEILGGFVETPAGTELKLKTVTGEARSLPVNEVKSQSPQPLSLMPEGLLNLLTGQEAADLLAYLESLR